MHETEINNYDHVIMQLSNSYGRGITNNKILFYKERVNLYLEVIHESEGFGKLFKLVFVAIRDSHG